MNSMNQENPIPEQNPESTLTRRERRLLRRQADAKNSATASRGKTLRGWGIGIVTLGVIVAGIWGLTRLPAVRQVGNILNSCVNHGGVSAMHDHTVLRVIVNGKERTTPKDIGIDGGCMRPLHTHDISGTIHIESPVRREFTLDQFFTVWKQPFSREQILDMKVDDTHEIIMSVNGTSIETFGETVLRDRETITIEYREKVKD